MIDSDAAGDANDAVMNEIMGDDDPRIAVATSVVEIIRRFEPTQTGGAAWRKGNSPRSALSTLSKAIDQRINILGFGL